MPTTALLPLEPTGPLATWAQSQNPARRGHGTTRPDGLRFAFYGRVSTEDYQNPATSRVWQLQQAAALTTGHGRIVTAYFDIGHSRSLPWTRRPEAAALLADLADPDRPFDAIVIGSSERAFSGNQYSVMAPLFAHNDVTLWIPELGGAADPEILQHEELMTWFGILDKREVARVRMRTHTAMTAQAREQGRYLGGRPPYGYRLVDAGPHPNRAWARRGARAQRLDINPGTAPIVKWIFAQRLARHSVARIARALNDMTLPCPSAADPGRNPHRPGTHWTPTAVRAILTNPRYTGHQVWNRQRTDHDLIDPADTTLGKRDTRRRNTPGQWTISREPAHPALVSETLFLAVQNISTTRAITPGRTYLLAGLLRCGHCDRRMESCWSHDHPAYRCRHGHTTATRPRVDRPRNAYLREDRVLPRLPTLGVRLGLPPQLTPPEIAARLRADQITLTYDYPARTLTASTPHTERIFIG